MNDNGVKVWSLTDHDTIAGWKNGEESARALGLTFIPGVEITCERGLNPRSEELIRNKRERALGHGTSLPTFQNLHMMISMQLNLPSG